MVKSGRKRHIWCEKLGAIEEYKSGMDEGCTMEVKGWLNSYILQPEQHDLQKTATKSWDENEWSLWYQYSQSLYW